MKKLFLAIAIMATSFVFAENVLSLNVSPLGTKITNGEFRDRNIDSEIREYIYLYRQNIITYLIIIF